MALESPPPIELNHLEEGSRSATPSVLSESLQEKNDDPPTEKDPFVVDWEPADDALNPSKWSPARKWTNIGALSFITFLTPLASSMFAPGVPQVMADFHTTSDLMATFVVSVYVLGFAFGPLIFAPLSEIYGRRAVYNVTNVFFVTFTVCCAVAKNMGMLIAFRFLAGFVGVATITCGSGTISDMLPPEQRGGAMAIWSVGPLLGPVIGPVVGGFLTQSKGWRWVFYILAMGTCCSTVLGFFALDETYHPLLLERKAARLRLETGNSAYRSKYATGASGAALLKQSLIRPLKMLAFSPIITLMCIYIAITYGILYILFTTFTFVFEGQYGFTPSTAGLTFIGSGIGNLLGLAYVGSMSDRLLRTKLAAGQRIRPEDRLPLQLTVPVVLAIPSGLFIYGWTAQYKVHWIAPMIGTGITGFGMIGALICIQTYLVDAYTRHAASVVAANALLRSLLGALLPLGALDLYGKIGLGWGNSLLGFIALALAPAPLMFHFYGERIRTNPRWQRDF